MTLSNVAALRDLTPDDLWVFGNVLGGALLDGEPSLWATTTMGFRERSIRVLTFQPRERVAQRAATVDDPSDYDNVFLTRHFNFPEHLRVDLGQPGAFDKLRRILAVPDEATGRPGYDFGWLIDAEIRRAVSAVVAAATWCVIIDRVDTGLEPVRAIYGPVFTLSSAGCLPKEVRRGRALIAGQQGVYAQECQSNMTSTTGGRHSRYLPLAEVDAALDAELLQSGCVLVNATDVQLPLLNGCTGKLLLSSSEGPIV